MAHSTQHTKLIKSHAQRLGFLSCGISKAGFLEKEAPRLEKWLSEKRHGEMQYMENHFDKRLDPTKLVPGAKSVVSLLYNYYPEKTQKSNTYKIAKYAFGTDYHFVVKDKLKELLAIINQEIGAVSGRAFVDSAPILEHAWAVKSGLGWLGKNANVISKKQGSFYFIAELIIDLELDYDACPTQAIVEPYKVDGSKCISYFTIELKDEIPQEMKGTFNDWIFGCDICQDVCPWNRFSKPHNQPLFNPTQELLNYTKQDWEEITEDIFKDIFKKSPVKRTKFEGLKRNISFIKNP